MSDRELYLSYGLQAVDAKGRVAVPAKLRAALERNAEARDLLIARDAAHGCLIGFDVNWPRVLHARLDPRELAIEDSGETVDYNVAGNAFGNLESAPFDSAGRFVLPAFFRRRAQIEKWAFFHGRGNTFTIWNPDVLLADASIAEETRELVEFCMEEKGLR